MSEKLMDAIIKPVAGEGVALAKVPVPEAGPGEVLIKIHKTAICGSDVHIYDWNDWAAQHVKPGMTIGHEYVGEIAALGAGVTGLYVGQRVSGEGHITCGHCRNCRNGDIQWCKDTFGVGVDRNGAFAEYLCIPASNVIPIDPNLDEDVVAFFDAFGNATHTALMWSLVGEDVLITGAGPIGIMAAGICKYAGARRVVITDLNEYRLDLARKMGVDAAVNTGKEDLNAVMKQLNIVEGFDVGLEMSGSEIAFNSMIDHMVHGGRMALLGILKSDAKIDWSKVIFNGLVIKGIYGRQMHETWYKMSAMLQGGLDISNIITHRMDIRDFEAGFEAMNSGKCGKVILDWTKLSEENN